MSNIYSNLSAKQAGNPIYLSHSFFSFTPPLTTFSPSVPLAPANIILSSEGVYTVSKVVDTSGVKVDSALLSLINSIIRR